MRHAPAFAAFLVVAQTPLAFAPATGATLVVPDQYPAIQAAILAASGGDSVLVRPGTYVENIRFRGKRIAVVSEAGPAATIIDGSQPVHPDTGTVAVVDGAGALIEGFTIRGGTGSLGFQLYRSAGGVALVATGTIRGNWITENEVLGELTSGGGGIYVSDLGAYRVIVNRIYSNRTTGRGGGILTSGGYGVVSDNEIFDNEAGSGGGANNVSALFVTYENNVIACNHPGGINNAYYVRNNTIVGNGVYGARFNYRIEFLHNTVTHNLGVGDYCDGTPPGSCNNFFANAAEDSTCFGSGSANISVDPRYGDAGCSASFCLRPDSPLLPDHSPPGCGLIGARGACPALAVDAPASPEYAAGPLAARPNPFNPATTLSFKLHEARHVSLEVVDVRGRLVARLLERVLPAGVHEMAWDGRDASGQAVSSGAYVAVLSSTEARFSQKLLLIR